MPNRRGALWKAQGLARAPASDLPYEVSETPPAFAELDSFQTIAWDYRTSYHSARGHPLEAIRDQLRAQGLPDARTVANMRDGRRVRYAGIVICRQRPGTASGVVFMTLEDETGFVNGILWPNVFEKYSVLARAVSFLGVTGRLQVAENVVHLVAEHLWEPRITSPLQTTRSRDFH